MKIRLTIAALLFTFCGGSGVALAADGGQAGGHMSGSGTANSNAQSGAEAMRGRDRADSRKSDQGQMHQQAGQDNPGDAKPQAKGKKADKAKKADQAKKAGSSKKPESPQNTN